MRAFYGFLRMCDNINTLLSTART